MKAAFESPWSPAHEASLGSVGRAGNLLGAVEEEDDEGDEEDTVRERERLSLREAKRGRLKKQLEEMSQTEPRARPSIDQNAMGDDDNYQEGLEAKPGEPVVVAIADFDPPRSHETQML